MVNSGYGRLMKINRTMVCMNGIAACGRGGLSGSFKLPPDPLIRPSPKL